MIGDKKSKGIGKREHMMKKLFNINEEEDPSHVRKKSDLKGKAPMNNIPYVESELIKGNNIRADISILADPSYIISRRE